MTKVELARVDLALMNLLCAKELPRAENLDISKCLATLDEWAQRVKAATERHLYRLTDPQYADHYRHSESYLRAEFLCQVLQEDCGVHYNLKSLKDPDFKNSQDVFIHGMIGNDNGGTCASMPVLYVAVGRRLGYPLKVVLAKAHVFARWDNGASDRFNMEATDSGGMDTPEDSFYHDWPIKLSPEELASGEYLKSLTPVEELASCIFKRGTCLHHLGRLPEARAAFAEATRLMPNSTNMQNALLASVGFRPERLMRRPGPWFDPDDPTPRVPIPGASPPTVWGARPPPIPGQRQP